MFFDNVGAIGVNALDKSVTRWPRWKTPYYTNGNIAEGTIVIGTDKAGVLYAIAPTALFSATYLLLAADTTAQAWVTLTTFTVNITSYWLDSTMSGDKESITIAYYNSDQQKIAYVQTFSLTKKTWSDSRLTSTYPFYPFPPFLGLPLPQNPILLSVNDTNRITLALASSSGVKLIAPPNYFAGLLPSDYPVYEGHYIIPGCGKAPKEDTWNVRLFDTGKMEVVTDWIIPLKENRYLWPVCDYTWISTGCK